MRAPSASRSSISSYSSSRSTCSSRRTTGCAMATIPCSPSRPSACRYSCRSSSSASRRPACRNAMEEFELEPGESITIAVRTHWLLFVLELLPYFIFALVPLFIFPVAAHFASGTPAVAENLAQYLSVANPWVRLFLGMWWLVMWTGAFNAFTRYYLDQWIVTTTRIVDIHQFGFFRRHVSSFLLNHVQDVTTDVSGVLPTLFGFGTLRVE